MNLERIQYRMYKLRLILIPIALLLIAVIFIVVGQHIGGRDRPELETTPTPTLALEDINSEEVLTLQEHLAANCVLVEVTFLDNFNTATKIETYYDYMSNNFEQYKLDIVNGKEQYAKLKEVCKFSGMAHPIGTALEELPTDCKDYVFDKLDENMYKVSSLTDGYIWLAKQKELGNTLNTVKITATYMDIYFTENAKQKRAIITDKYILVDDYIGDVPNY